MLSKLLPLTIKLNDTDVTDCYAPQKVGAIEISDSVNQPVTSSLGLMSSRLPFPIRGGELLTVADSEQIYFDGMLPVESGIGTEFLYLDAQARPEVYRKMVRITATDYQSVLDFKNSPDRTFYDQTCKQIIQALIDLSPLRGLVDYSDFADGYKLPQYAVAGRKFSNIIKELGQMNGFYFALRTVSIDEETGARLFKAEFRSLADRPAPFSVDRDATKYLLSSVKFDPRDTPLCNRITVVGGLEPSKDIQVDEFLVGPADGRFVLSKVPFWVKTSELFTSDFSKEIIQPSHITDTEKNTNLILTGADGVFTSGPNADSPNELQCKGWGTLIFTPSFHSRDRRYTTFEEITLDAGANIAFGLLRTPEEAFPGNVAIGAYFKPDGTVAFLLDGEEHVPLGNPTWRARTNTGEANIYSVRVKETQQGTLCEIQGGNLSPVRHWMPVALPGDRASGYFYFTGTPAAGDTIAIKLGDLSIAAYAVTQADADDSTLETLHTSVRDWLNGGAVFSGEFQADCEMMGERRIIRVTAKTFGSQYNQDWNITLNSAGLEPAWNGLTGGTDVGANGDQLPDAYYAGIVCGSASRTTVHRIIARDPVGVEVQMVRGPLHISKIANNDPDRIAELMAAQQTVVLTVGSGNEVAELFSAQVLMEGQTAVLSFFDDPDSLPQEGDQLRVAYRYGVPIKVTVQDYTSCEMVRQRSRIPGDTGVREGSDIDLKDKIFSSESATRYASQYLSSRSALTVQGSVATNTMLTDGVVPRSGQTLSFLLPADDLKRTEVVTQVTARHRGTLNMFDYSVAFGKVPDEFLLPVENPNLGNGPDTFTYDVQAIAERLRLADDEIKFTVI